MVYLHSEIKEGKIHRWANEIKDGRTNAEGYYEPTYKIQKVGTNQIYVSAIDLLNEERESLGLQPYEYVVTDIKIERTEEIK